MHNLAVTYGDLERHQDALALQEQTLEFLRRVLPENHPHIGVIRLCLLIRLFYVVAFCSRQRNELSCCHVR